MEFLKQIKNKKIVCLAILTIVSCIVVSIVMITHTGDFAVATTDGNVTFSRSDGITTWFISADGTYTLSGSAANTKVSVESGLTVSLVLNGVTIDNSSVSTDDPVIELSKKTDVTVKLEGDSRLIGGSGAAKALIYQKAECNESAIDFSGDGTLNLINCADNVDGIRTNGRMTVKGGTYIIDVYGDGIQAWSLDISGGKFDIDTHFSNAGLNYYNPDLGAGTSLGAYNTVTVDDGEMISTKSETVNIDTGSHKGIKAGTKARTFIYTSVEKDSDYTAGRMYQEEASGGLTISGGNIDVNTMDTGIKYNVPPEEDYDAGRITSGSGNLIGFDRKVIIGAPEDAIKSNNDCSISGGTVIAASPDDGISVAGALDISGSAVIDITMAYEGIEASSITVGTGTDSPSISVYTNDDGINAAGKDNVTYIYADESENTYTKTTVSGLTGHDMTVYSGSIEVSIGDDVSTHGYSLPVANGCGILPDESAFTGTYTSDGDGIDCNGSFRANGGKITIWGTNNEFNSPVDTADDGEYEISSGAVVIAASSMISMPNNPTSLGQYAVEYIGTTFPAGTVYINDGNTAIATVTAPKEFSYFMYSSDALLVGTGYTLTDGGTSKTAEASASVTGSGVKH